MLKSLFLTVLLLAVYSCAPSKIENVEQMNSNSQEISTLEGDIEQLKAEIKNQNEEIEKQKAQNKKNNIPVVSNDPNYNQLKANLDELRSDLIRMIQQIENKLNKRLEGLESKYTIFKNKLNNIEDNYVSLSAFEALSLDIKRDLKKKENALILLKQNTANKDEIAKIQNQVDELVNTQINVKEEYKRYFDVAIKAWSSKLLKYINESNSEQSDKLKTFIRKEVERLKISIEASEDKIAAMDEEIDALMNEDNTPANLPDYSDQIKELQQTIKQNEQLLASIKEEVGKAKMPGLYSEIIEKQYAPCVSEGGLKGKNFCFTFGSLITRLGGVFIDPTNLPKTMKGYLSYLTLSGITIDSPFSNYKAYLQPSPSNMEKLRACHGNSRKNLLPPQELWPRGVLLSLILQNIENDLKRQKELGFITNKATPVKGISSWYRTECYQGKISRLAPNNSDHVYASAFDLSFGAEKSDDTFEFYREYILNNIWKNDTFEIVHPLKSANMTFAVGIGLGHGSHGKGQFHIGIGSQVNTGKKRRDWGYKSNGKKYTELLRYESE